MIIEVASMFGRILFISDNMAEVENISKGNISADLMNVHVIFETGDQRILGEVTEINDEVIKIRFLGEYLNGRYVNGIMRKPLLSSKIRIINNGELLELVGKPSNKSFTLGKSAVYKNYTIISLVDTLQYLVTLVQVNRVVYLE